MIKTHKKCQLIPDICNLMQTWNIACTKHTEEGGRKTCRVVYTKNMCAAKCIIECTCVDSLKKMKWIV